MLIVIGLSFGKGKNGMSMDNYIYIDKKFNVWDCVASWVGGKTMAKQKINCLKGFKSLKEAIEFADKQESEYGTSFHLWAK